MANDANKYEKYSKHIPTKKYESKDVQTKNDGGKPPVVHKETK